MIITIPGRSLYLLDIIYYPSAWFIDIFSARAIVNYDSASFPSHCTNLDMMKMLNPLYICFFIMLNSLTRMQEAN